MNQTPKTTSRRRFLLRLLNSSLLAAATAFTGIALYDRRRPEIRTSQSDEISPPDFSVSTNGPALAIAHGKVRQKTLASALKALGGMTRFIQPGDRVLIKVNAAFAAPPSLSATTHPDLVAELGRQCAEAGASSVTITDYPINDPAACFALSGIDAAARKVGARVVLPRNPLFRNISLPNARLIRNWPVLWQPLQQADKLIGVAPLKDHHRSGASMVLKNWYGLLGGRRNIFHQDVHSIITELAGLVKPTLVVLDGTTTMMRNGPTGGSLSDLKTTDTLIAGTDQVAVDAYGAGLLEKPLAELAFIRRAATAGAGTDDFNSLNPIIVNAT